MATSTLTSSKLLQFRSAKRVQESVLARMEKATLIWMAKRIPSAIKSDHLTILGFAAQVATGVCYAFARFNRAWLVACIACLALNWLGDSLDGTLARVRDQQRPRYGSTSITFSTALARSRSWAGWRSRDT